MKSEDWIGVDEPKTSSVDAVIAVAVAVGSCDGGREAGGGGGDGRGVIVVVAAIDVVVVVVAIVVDDDDVVVVVVVASVFAISSEGLTSEGVGNAREGGTEKGVLSMEDSIVVSEAETADWGNSDDVGVICEIVSISCERAREEDEEKALIEGDA